MFFITDILFLNLIFWKGTALIEICVPLGDIKSLILC